jgi:hypothetical protein
MINLGRPDALTPWKYRLPSVFFFPRHVFDNSGGINVEACIAAHLRYSKEFKAKLRYYASSFRQSKINYSAIL